jgi:hypothetical protein
MGDGVLIYSGYPQRTKTMPSGRYGADWRSSKRLESWAALSPSGCEYALAPTWSWLAISSAMGKPRKAVWSVRPRTWRRVCWQGRRRTLSPSIQPPAVCWAVCSSIAISAVLRRRASLMGHDQRAAHRSRRGDRPAPGPEGRKRCPSQRALIGAVAAVHRVHHRPTGNVGRRRDVLEHIKRRPHRHHQ